MTYAFRYEFIYMKNIVKSFMQSGATKISDVLYNMLNMLCNTFVTYLS